MNTNNYISMHLKDQTFQERWEMAEELREMVLDQIKQDALEVWDFAVTLENLADDFALKEERE